VAVKRIRIGQPTPELEGHKRVSYMGRTAPTPAEAVSQLRGWLEGFDIPDEKIMARELETGVWDAVAFIPKDLRPRDDG
jgi:hypothetical protein